MRLAKRLAFLGFDLIFGIVKGEQPLTRCWESGVREQGGGIETPSALARAERKPLDQKRKHPPRYQCANLLKEELTLMQSKLPQRYSFTAKINF